MVLCQSSSSAYDGIYQKTVCKEKVKKNFDKHIVVKYTYSRKFVELLRTYREETTCLPV